MAVSFPSLPPDYRRPLYYVEVDPSQAGRPVIEQRALIIGHSVTGKTASDFVAYPTNGDPDEARTLFGDGSMVATALRDFRRGNKSSEVLCMSVPEVSGGTAATGTITVTVTTAVAGTIALYVDGQKIQVAVAAGDADSDIATAIAAAINAATDLPVTAAAALAVVTLTCKWKGETGNYIDIQHSYLGLNGGEELPGGVSLAIVAMASGAGQPDLSSAIAALGDEPYEHVLLPWTDTASLNAFRDEFGFGSAGRWGWERQLFGHVWSAKRGTQGELTTFGNARNDGVIGVFGYEAGAPTSPWNWAAMAMAQASAAYYADPARPLQTLALVGALPAKPEDRFTGTERNVLLFDGVATTYVDQANVVHIERAISTYQKNAFGFGDDAFLDTTTLATLALVIREQRARITTKFPRHKLADNGTAFGPGQAIVTPNVIRSELIAHYASLENRGLVENMRAFKDNLVVERSDTDPNRVNVVYPPDLINQLRVFAVLAQFRLQYDRFASAA